MTSYGEYQLNVKSDTILINNGKNLSDNLVKINFNQGVFKTDSTMLKAPGILGNSIIAPMNRGGCGLGDINMPMFTINSGNEKNGFFKILLRILFGIKEKPETVCDCKEKEKHLPSYERPPVIPPKMPNPSYPNIVFNKNEELNEEKRRELLELSAKAGVIWN